MTELLLRLFVPNRDNTEDTAVRIRYGIVAGLVGIVCNVLLFLGKLAIGFLSKSVAIMADAVNNLSDASSSIITLIGFSLAKRPADSNHPYGHARFEYISGLAVAALILMIGVQLVIASVKKIINPEPLVFSLALVIVLTLSIFVKLWMAGFNRKLGKKISSKPLLATAVDSRNDVISTSAVLLSAVLTKVTGLQLDGYIGLAVALFILYSGVEIGKDTIKPLLGEGADPELRELIKEKTLGFSPIILGIHDLMVHDYGPGRRFASLHAEIDCQEDVLYAHEILDNIECMFQEEYNIEMVIHYDPIVTDDEELNYLREIILEKLEEMDERLSSHDFRMVRGKGHSNLIFDVVLPYELRGEEERIKEELRKTVETINRKYYLVINYDYGEGVE